MQHVTGAWRYARNDAIGVQFLYCRGSGEVHEGGKTAMFSQFEDQDPQSLITATPYCWPIGSLDELRQASFKLRNRPEHDHEEFQQSVAAAVDEHLNTTGPDGSGSITNYDETGHRILFVHLLTPLAQERSKRLAKLDDAAQGIPLLVTILLPELAFNISELEEAYGFMTYMELESQFGPNVDQHVRLHKGAFYVDVSGLITVLSQWHPALLVSLAFAVVFARDVQTIRTYEFLKSVNDALLRNELTTLNDEYFEQVYQGFINVLIEAQEIIQSLLASEESCLPEQLVSEAFNVLLIDEKQAFDHLHDKIINSPAVESEIEVSSSGVERLCRLSRRVRSRLSNLRKALPA
jgi:hypothetical protein